MTKPLVFMGREFANVERLKEAFPAFRGDDAIRAIRDGATTPMEVEIACLAYRNAARQRVLKQCRKNGQKINAASLKARERKAQKRKARAA